MMNSEIEENSPPRWLRLMVCGRHLFAALYILAVGVLYWAVFCNHVLLHGPADTDLESVSIFFAILAIMPALFLLGAPHWTWPRPRRRRHIAVSVMAGSLMAALLSIGLIATGLSFFASNGLKNLDVDTAGRTALLLVVPWTFWLVVFAAMGLAPWHAAFARMYRVLLSGTILELLVTIPVDVQVRKRTNCYCGEGTFWGLILGLTLLFWTLGPGIVLLFLTRRRQRLHTAFCLHCSYDLRGLPSNRCPECGNTFMRRATPALEAAMGPRP